jgi:hypothetical protein
MLEERTAGIPPYLTLTKLFITYSGKNNFNLLLPVTFGN